VKASSAASIADTNRAIIREGKNEVKAETNRYKKPPMHGGLAQHPQQPKKSKRTEFGSLNMAEILSKIKNLNQCSKSGNRSSISFDKKPLQSCEVLNTEAAKKKKRTHFRHKSAQSEADVGKITNHGPSKRQINFAIRTKKGVNGDLKKFNQDSLVSIINFRGNPNEHLFGVFDGHGTNGHLVSNFISTHIQNILAAKLLQNQSPDIALHNTYKALYESLVRGHIDITFSGSTAVACLIQDDVVYCANAGDSRAILGYEQEDGTFSYKALSTDHKLELESERKRIEAHGGIVNPFFTEQGEACGPLRVWMPGKNFPGLAMSRCIGDLLASSLGVQWQPGIIC
jgi:serine/threonine protein phosphatase PrpC